MPARSPGTTPTEFLDVAGTTQAAGGTRLASPVDVVRTAPHRPPGGRSSGSSARLTADAA
ncbi:hypothetical protein [Streptomyces sp. NBC_01614]|uniref:hypothetical protein n=1 Tax=Streptomyces sp. NBC_01614 TaxID=2975897 RepID=UPI00386C4E3D